MSSWTAAESRSFLTRSLACVAVLLMVWATWSWVRGGNWVDIDVYVMGAQRILHGQDLYSAATDHGLPFTYSPFAAMLFMPLTLTETDQGRYIFTALSLTCLIITVALVSKRLGLDRLSAITMIGLGVALEPAFRTLLLGQINFLIVALVVTDWTLMPRRHRGYLTGIAVGVKITPAAFILLALLQRDWATARRILVTFGCTVVIGTIAAPADTLAYWTGGFASLGKFGLAAVIGADNQSLLGCWMRIFGVLYPPDLVKCTLLAAGLALGGAAAWLELRRGDPDAEMAAFSWVALGALLGSPISWSHHWVYMVVVLAVLLKRKRYVELVVASALFWFPTIWLVRPGNLNELMFGIGEKFLSSTYCIAAVCILARTMWIAQKPPAHRAAAGAAPLEKLGEGLTGAAIP